MWDTFSVCNGTSHGGVCFYCTSTAAIQGPTNIVPLCCRSEWFPLDPHCMGLDFGLYEAWFDIEFKPLNIFNPFSQSIPKLNKP
ncbi:MAG: hypothetical protein ACFE95_05435 [Candidatus Hodarchaeota archaeon]